MVPVGEGSGLMRWAMVSGMLMVSGRSEVVAGLHDGGGARHGSPGPRSDELYPLRSS